MSHSTEILPGLVSDQKTMLDHQRDHSSNLACATYEAYGCHVNAISVDELFHRYALAGFLYPAKMSRLNPFWHVIQENWKRALRGGELIHYIVTADLPDGSWASLTSWRSTNVGWNTQHLVGIGGPDASRAVMLGTQALRIADQFDCSHQNWFQRANRFANKKWTRGNLNWNSCYVPFNG